MLQETISIETTGRGTFDISDQVNNILSKHSVENGLCHIFLMHTSASLILCENYDPTVKDDMENFLSRLVPDGDKIFKHTMEGPDDMPAHIRSILTHNDITIPIIDGKLRLGTWQGIYLYEHRTRAHNRNIIVTLY